MLGISIILMIIAAALFLPTLMTINSRYQIALAQVARLEAMGVIVKPVDIQSLNGRARTLEQKLAAPESPNPFIYIDRIRSTTPGGITLHGFSINDTTTLAVEVTGVASTRAQLQSFVASLQTDETVERVDSPLTNFVKGTQSDFTITVIFKKTS